MTHSEF